MIPGVIVVDDSEIDRYLVRRLIERGGLSERIVELDDGDRFIDLIADAERARRECGEPPPPILVLLDINMPRMNGFEVLAEIEQLHASAELGVPPCIVMMFTSSDNESDRERSFRYAFVKDYLVKPIDAKSLCDVIRKHYQDG